jgi:hypothetical protein
VEEGDGVASTGHGYEVRGIDVSLWRSAHAGEERIPGGRLAAGARVHGQAVMRGPPK